MSRSPRFITAAVVTLALVPAILLTGCGASEARTFTLADTKPAAQLLRNEVAGRIPSDMVESLGATKDTSVDCGDGGVKRSWSSTVLMYIEPSTADKLEATFDDVNASLEESGWTVKPVDSSENIHESRLKSTNTEAVIHITAVDAVDEKGNGATVAVAVNGPCVVTDGPDSDEVKDLEDAEQ